MKLPDFTDDPDLIALRTAMGATSPGGFSTSYRPDGLSLVEIEKLANEGIEVSIDEITKLPDGTLGYKDSRVLVYIRDVPLYGDSFSLPKFHVAFCRTLDKMKANNRFSRYVVATKKDGEFPIHKIASNKIIRSSEKLNVCQNCLSALAFDGFNDSMRGTDRRRAVGNFSIEIFFQAFPKSLHTFEPKYDDMTAPINAYGSGFAEAGRRIKAERGLTCEECELTVPPNHRKFIQAHHMDGAKYNDESDNLRLLCMRCHADQFLHGHVKRTDLYKEFLKIYPRRA